MMSCQIFRFQFGISVSVGYAKYIAQTLTRRQGVSRFSKWEAYYRISFPKAMIQKKRTARQFG